MFIIIISFVYVVFSLSLATIYQIKYDIGDVIPFSGKNVY